MATVVVSETMGEDPVRHQYRSSDRAELFDFLRESLSTDDSERLIKQWSWRYEASPFNPAEGPTIDIIRIGTKLVALVAGFRVRMSMGGIECFGESRGVWLVHPKHRGHHLWRRVGTLHSPDTPILFGWSRVPGRAAVEDQWVVERITPLLRVLDLRSLIEQFTNSRWLSAIGGGVSAAARLAGELPGHARGDRSHPVVRLSSFDDRVDAIFDRARRAHLAMVVRDHRYLNWRYCQRPDATYMLFGVECGSELSGFLVARACERQGVPWGYIVDFLAPATSGEVLSSLVGQALDEFRVIGVAAVVCFATDPVVRHTLFRHGFFPFPQRRPMHFNRSILAGRNDLAKFAVLRNWYVTMGDGDLEMAP